MEATIQRVVLLAATLLVLPAASAAQGPAIQHEAVGCVVAERFPEIEACFRDGAEVARARVQFRAKGGKHWYYVEMSRRPDSHCFSGVLPRPKKDTRHIQYYVDAVGPGLGESRTPEYQPQVASTCGRKLVVAGSLGSASIALGAPSGAPAVPAGFSSLGIASAAGTAATPAAGGSGGGGGAGKTLLILGGLGAAGAAAYVGLREGDPCNGASVRVTVSPGTAPAISWSPDTCPATALFVNPVSRAPTEPARRWAVNAPRISPPVTFGVLPPGAQQTIGPFPLLSGVPYVAQVIGGRGASGECDAAPNVGACHVMGELTFTP